MPRKVVLEYSRDREEEARALGWALMGEGVRVEYVESGGRGRLFFRVDGIRLGPEDYVILLDILAGADG